MSTSIQPNAPFRADIVGSFLRPQAVKDARAAYVAGKLDASGLKAVEDEAIRDLVAKQKAAGLQVITDGEFRRNYWHLDFMWGSTALYAVPRVRAICSTTRRLRLIPPW